MIAMDSGGVHRVDSRVRLTSAAERLRAAMSGDRAHELPRTIRLLERTLADTDRVLSLSPPPPSHVVEREAIRVDCVLDAWEALLAF